MDSLFYNTKWNEWDDMIVYSPAPKHRRRIILKLLKWFAREGSLVHDIGCGNGFLLKEIKKGFEHFALSGSDISDEIINKNKSVITGIEFYTLDISKDLPYHPTQYDVVICSEVLEHVEHLDIAIRNLYKLLKPEGIAILTLPCGKIYKIDEMVGHHRHFKDSSLFQDYFVVKKEIHWGVPFFNLYKWAINLRPDYMNERFCKTKYNFMEKMLSMLVYLLFFLNLDVGGEQLILVLSPRKFPTVQSNVHYGPAI